MKVRLLVYCLVLLPVKPLLAQPDVTAWEVLKIGLNDKYPERRRQAVTAIGSIGLNPEAVKQVEHGLRDDDPTVRQTAAAVLGQNKSTQSIPALKAALDDPSGEVAFTAARALWDMGDHSGEPVLQDVMTGQQKSSVGALDSAVRGAKETMHSPKALAKLGFKEASGALLGPFSIGIYAAEEFSKDSGALGRALAASLLAQVCDERTLQLLQFELKEDRNNTVKAAVAKALGRCGTKDDIPRLEAYLSSSNLALKLMSAAAIVRLTNPEASKSTPVDIIR